MSTEKQYCSCKGFCKGRDGLSSRYVCSLDEKPGGVAPAETPQLCGMNDKGRSGISPMRWCELQAGHAGPCQFAAVMPAEPIPAPPPERETALREALKLAKEAANGWACVAKRQREHDEIARLHREIAALEASDAFASVGRGVSIVEPRQPAPKRDLLQLTNRVEQWCGESEDVQPIEFIAETILPTLRALLAASPETGSPDLRARIEALKPLAPDTFSWPHDAGFERGVEVMRQAVLSLLGTQATAAERKE